MADQSSKPLGLRLGERAAAEGPGPAAAVGRRGVDHEVDAAVALGHLAQRGEDRRLVGDVHLQGVRPGRAHPLERLRRAGAAGHRPPVGEQALDDRVAEVASADDQCGGHRSERT
ncbi:MAG: hypothetical protein WKF31_13595, partial [Thermoleophilaceae bacterium]